MRKWDELTREEKLACILLYPEDAKRDVDADVRQEAYRALGYTEDAKKDVNWNIRQEAKLYFKVLLKDAPMN